MDEIDFQALVSGEKVHSVAEIHLLNHEKVTTGVLQQMLKEVSYRALPSALVEKIELDVGGMRVGDTIRYGIWRLPLTKMCSCRPIWTPW